MLLAPGARLGAYEVLGFIGAGGMGEVYRARDPRLDRHVALKISTAEFGERFEREARAVAALNHPHICTVHDVGPNYLVMEYIDGTPLTGPLPLDLALKYAAQIADALDAAHTKHIIHRDLKPGNILVTKAGVKLLDFGLARIEAESDSDSLPSGTARALTALTTEGALTVQGATMGTVPYMSPEQLQGRRADARSDIFALGLVLYEMLTGKRAFGGSNAASVIGAILERPAPVIEPEPVHREVNRLIATCVAKDPDDRFQTARDLKRAIEWIASGVETPAVARGASRAWIIWAAAAAVFAALAVIGWFRPQPAVDAADLALTIVPPSAGGIEPLGSSLGKPEISPNGAFVTYHDRTRTLKLRRLNAASPETLQGVAGLNTQEIWSRDSMSLVFSDATNLKRIRVPDGAPEIIGKLPGPLTAGTLSDSGVLLFLSIVGNRGSVWMIPPGASEATEVTLPGTKEAVSQGPQFLPGGEDVLIGLQSVGSNENQIYLFTLRDGQLVDPAPLMKNASGARYTPAGGGRVLFVRNFNLYSQPFNRATRKLEGDEELVQESVATAGPTAYFSVSDTGVVVWRPGRPAPPQVTIFDRQGKPVGTAGPQSGGFLSMKLSPDERRLLVSAPGQSWLLEPNQPGRLAVNQGNLTMLWSPDGSRFLVPQGSRVVERPVSGAGETRELASAPGLERLEDVSADGKVALFTNGAFASAVFSLRLDGIPEQRLPTPVLQTGEWVWNTRFSHDARWIVFQVAGQDRGIYVQQFPGPGLRKQLTSTGEYPMWRKDGREIVYLDENRIWSLPVDTSSGEVRAGVAEPLFTVRPVSRALDLTPLAVSRDGSRFYFPQAVEQPDSDVIHVKIGWLSPR
jgi:predicted Ser/Thr protein kinase